MKTFLVVAAVLLAVACFAQAFMLAPLAEWLALGYAGLGALSMFAAGELWGREQSR